MFFNKIIKVFVVISFLIITGGMLVNAGQKTTAAQTEVQATTSYLLKVESMEGKGGSLAIFSGLKKLRDLNSVSTGLQVEFTLESADQQMELVYYPKYTKFVKEISSLNPDRARVEKLNNSLKISFEDADDNDFNDLIVSLNPQTEDEKSASSQSSQAQESENSSAQTSNSNSTQNPETSESSQVNSSIEAFQPAVPNPTEILENSDELRFETPKNFQDNGQTLAASVCDLQVTAPSTIGDRKVGATTISKHIYHDHISDSAFVDEFEVASNLYLGDHLPGTNISHNLGFLAIGCYEDAYNLSWDYAESAPGPVWTNQSLYQTTGWEFTKEATSIKNVPKTRGNFEDTQHNVVFKVGDTWYWTHFSTPGFKSQFYPEFKAGTGIFANQIKVVKI